MSTAFTCNSAGIRLLRALPHAFVEYVLRAFGRCTTAGALTRVRKQRKVTMRVLVFVACWCLAGCAPERHPNVIVLMADDQGYGDLSITGNATIVTPNIDRIGREGAQFDRFYVSPVCSPTRAELLTGLFHPRLGVHGTSAGAERMSAVVPTLADIFHQAGYATGVFGKWHNGQQAPYHPNSRGFDEFYGFPSGHWGHYFNAPMEHNGVWMRGTGYLPDDITSAALRFINAHEHQPFLAFIPFNTPHSPMQVPDEYWDRVGHLVQRHRQPELEDSIHTRAALAMMLNLDWNVGRVLDRLDSLGLQDDTIVLYLSDNGPNGARWNDGMKGRKGSTDEGGVRSPLLVRWPHGIVPGTSIADIAAVIDLLPTLAELAGVPMSLSYDLDGMSLAGRLRGTTTSAPERILFSHWRGRTSVRSQRFRLSHDNMLFDMVEDPGQRIDVRDSFPDQFDQLLKARHAWFAEVVPDSFPSRPFTVGHPGATATHLPARDARAAGGIMRSNRYPNDSHLTNWTSTSDSIFWEINVLTAGRYQAVLHHTVSRESVGASITLTFGDQAVSARTTEAHDPPVYGMADDRVPRIESYVKDFSPLELGAINLPASTGLLVLSATDIPGDAVLDFRLLTLRRID